MSNVTQFGNEKTRRMEKFLALPEAKGLEPMARALAEVDGVTEAQAIKVLAATHSDLSANMQSSWDKSVHRVHGNKSEGMA